jgi:adenylosuccinate lyase
MAIVSAGGDRQIAHEHIRSMSMKVSERMATSPGSTNNLLQLIREEPYFSPIHDQLDHLARPDLFIGLAVQQVENYLNRTVYPLLNSEIYRVEYEASKRSNQTHKLDI